jgi:hypothetical protein
MDLAPLHGHADAATSQGGTTALVFVGLVLLTAGAAAWLWWYTGRRFGKSTGR